MEDIRYNLSVLTEDMLLSTKSDDTRKTISLLPANVSVMVVSKLIPPQKLIRVQLPHHHSELTVCVLVKDTDKYDYNKTTDAWKLRWKSDLTKSKISASTVSIPTFLPLRELKLAYQTFAAKRRLAASFDLFLADRRIVHHIPTNLGKAFYGEMRGKIPVPVNVSTNSNLVKSVLSTSSVLLFSVRGNGTVDSVPIGTIDLPLAKLRENILAVCEKIVSEWPGGGLRNIRSIYVQTRGASVPLYFDSSESTMSTILSQGTQLTGTKQVNNAFLENTNPMALKRKPKKLSMTLLSRVMEDLPLPRNGLEGIFSKRSKTVTRPKRISVKRKGRASKS